MLKNGAGFLLGFDVWRHHYEPPAFRCQVSDGLSTPISWTV